MKKKCIIFDLADTIAELDPSPEQIIFGYIKQKYFIDLDKTEIRKSLIFLSNIFHFSSVKIKDELTTKEFYLNFNTHLLNMIGVSHICSPDELFNHLSKKKSQIS